MTHTFGSPQKAFARLPSWLQVRTRWRASGSSCRTGRAPQHSRDYLRIEPPATPSMKVCRPGNAYLPRVSKAPAGTASTLIPRLLRSARRAGTRGFRASRSDSDRHEIPSTRSRNFGSVGPHEFTCTKPGRRLLADFTEGMEISHMSLVLVASFEHFPCDGLDFGEAA